MSKITELKGAKRLQKPQRTEEEIVKSMLEAMEILDRMSADLDRAVAKRDKRRYYKPGISK